MDQVAEPPFIAIAPGAPDDHEVFLVVTLNVRDRGREFVAFLGRTRRLGRRSDDVSDGNVLAQEQRWLPLRVIVTDAAEIDPHSGHVGVYRDTQKQWRWRRIAANGRTVASSGEGYRRRRHAIKMAERMFPDVPLVVATT